MGTGGMVRGSRGGKGGWLTLIPIGALSLICFSIDFASKRYSRAAEAAQSLFSRADRHNTMAPKPCKVESSGGSSRRSRSSSRQAMRQSGLPIAFFS